MKSTFLHWWRLNSWIILQILNIYIHYYFSTHLIWLFYLGNFPQTLGLATSVCVVIVVSDSWASAFTFWCDRPLVSLLLRVAVTNFSAFSFSTELEVENFILYGISNPPCSVWKITSMVANYTLNRATTLNKDWANRQIFSWHMFNDSSITQGRQCIWVVLITSFPSPLQYLTNNRIPFISVKFILSS